MSDGISPNKLNDLSQVYIDQVAAFRGNKKARNPKRYRKVVAACSECTTTGSKSRYWFC